MQTQSLTGQWQFREKETDEWLLGEVPGSVHTDLVEQNLIPDPFAGDNELHVQWVAERDWEYRLVFQATPELLAKEQIFLVCDGLDTLADVTLNGQPLGHVENAFRQHRWDVKPLLATDENDLRIAFPSPLAHIAQQMEKHPLRAPSHSIPGSPYLRKPPYQFGWDWGPKLPTIGIWKDIRLEGTTAARLHDVHLRQRHDDGSGRVTISVDVTIERWHDTDLVATLRLTSPSGQIQESGARLPGDAETGTLAIEVADPQLWWPNGMGEQPLYDVEVTLLKDEIVCDQRTFTLGLRTLELCQEEDEFGTSFTFVVNDVPLFAKGANWIPADSFPARIDDEHLEHLVRSAAQANMNMLRVWGGGFYEEERFYDLCDRYGILVWQDFVFSCSIYPDDEAFVENVRAEAVEHVRRLRHRASLALWCGNNEIELGWVAWGWEKIKDSQRFMEAYDRMFHQLLPEICAAEDGDTAYWPSSPSSNTPFLNPNGTRAGDTHNWDVWHRDQPFEAYREHTSRFVSEFGFQSLPSTATIRTYTGEADRNINSYIMEHHQRNTDGNTKIMNYLTDHFRLPKDLDSLVYLTQILQAECMRIGVEFWRRNRHRTSGTLYWQLNDCWPVTSWSSLDYVGRWKVLHYAARRFYAPVLLSVEEKTPEETSPITLPSERVRIRWSAETPEGESLGDGVQFVGWEIARQFISGGERPPKVWHPEATFFLTNDLTEEWQGSVRWSLETLNGKVLQNGEESVTVPAQSATQVRTLDFSDQVDAQNRRQVVLVYELWQGNDRIGMGLMPFAPTKHLALADPELTVKVKKAKDGFEIEIAAKRVARFVWLELEDADVVFSDNGFDLPAGRKVTVTLPAIEGWTVKLVREALHVRSLTDSF